MNTLDLLNEISTSKLAKRTDKELQGFESARQKNTVWTKERFLPVWEDAEQNLLTLSDVSRKYGLNRQHYFTLCKRHKLPMVNRPKTTTKSLETRSNNIVNKPINQDIINGMPRKEWVIKWDSSTYNFDNRRARLRKKGLVD